MNARTARLTLGLAAFLAVAVGLASLPLTQSAEAESPQQAEASLMAQAAVGDAITYQGRLTSAGGTPINGTQAMRFVLYDAAAAGSALWDSGPLSVPVSDGLFSVALDVDQADFTGDAVWLSIIVAGETLSPRQPLHPTPYALGLKPGASVAGEPPDWSGTVLGVTLEGVYPTASALNAMAPATGSAVRAQGAGGPGLYASSNSHFGVRGSSIDGIGGYFSSENGYGLVVETVGSDHWDHGAYVVSNGGYGLYAQSAQNQGVRGEAGNVTGIAEPLGAVGVVGIGANRGVYGASSAGTGVYAVSASNYGIWGQSTDYRGVTGRTSRTDNNYGFYTPDNLYVGGTSTVAGALMQVMQNTGAEPLSPGDVVVFSGIDRTSTMTASPMLQVAKTGTASSTAVAGVVYSRFNLAAVAEDSSPPDEGDLAAIAQVEVTPAGDAARGEYVLVVVQGPAQVKASAVSGGIQPGDLLSTSSLSGFAGRTQEVSLQGVSTSLPGTTFGKALEPLTAGEEMVYVYVTLN